MPGCRICFLQPQIHGLWLIGYSITVSACGTVIDSLQGTAIGRSCREHLHFPVPCGIQIVSVRSGSFVNTNISAALVIWIDICRLIVTGGAVVLHGCLRLPVVVGSLLPVTLWLYTGRFCPWIEQLECGAGQGLAGGGIGLL